MSEQLFTCPRCKRGGFTHRGLIAHQKQGGQGCTKVSMAKPIKESKGLVILKDEALTVPKDHIKELQGQVHDQLAAIPRLESEAAARAIIAGIGLWRLKHSLGHGKWMPYFNQIGTSGANLPKRRQCSNYMALALVFVDKVRGINQETLGIALAGQLELNLTKPSDEQRTFFMALQDFVGAQSLNDLLDRYGIKERKEIGGARESTKSLGPVEDAEAIYDRYHADASKMLTDLKHLFIGEKLVERLAIKPKAASAIAAELRKVADEFEAQALRLQGKT